MQETHLLQHTMEIPQHTSHGCREGQGDGKMMANMVMASISQVKTPCRMSGGLSRAGELTPFAVNPCSYARPHFIIGFA